MHIELGNIFIHILTIKFISFLLTSSSVRGGTSTVGGKGLRMEVA